MAIFKLKKWYTNKGQDSSYSSSKMVGGPRSSSNILVIYYNQEHQNEEK